MVGRVVCSRCGRENMLVTVGMYDICSGCGAPLRASMGPPPTAPTVPPAPPPPRPPPPRPPPRRPPPPEQNPPYGEPPPIPAPLPTAPAPMYQVPYPPHYPLPYPYPVAPPPTNHPGVYERPEEAPRVDWDALARVLTRPRDAFRDLYGHTDARTGFFVYMMLIITGGLFSLLSDFTTFQGVGTTGLSMLGSPMPGSVIASFVAGLVISPLTFYGVCYLTHAILKSGKRALRPSLPKTIGLLSYAAMPGFVMSLFSTFTLYFVMDPLSIMVCVLALGTVSFFWSLWVQGHAVSVANDAPWSTSVGMVLLASLIIGMIIGMILTPILFVLLLRGM